MYSYDTIITLRDADAAGILYFARYFALAHDAYEAYLAEAGCSIARILDEASYIVPIVHAEADYRAPLRVGQKVQIRLKVEEVKSRSFTMRSTFHTENDQPACSVRTVHVAVEKATGKAIPLPDAIRLLVEKP